MGGSPRVSVLPGQQLPDLDWAGELAQLTSAWPYLGPTWLTATETAMPELRPWHTVATRARGELALVAGYVLDAPPAADHEPRTYLGWRPAGDEVSAEVDALGTGPFFPALLLGSPLGYRTEVAYNFWTPALMSSVVDVLAPAAFKAGIRCVVAPWIPDRRGNEALVDALVRAGGHSTFWGHESFMRLNADSWAEHLAGQSAEARQRITAGVRNCAASGVTIERADGPGVRPHIARVAELTCLIREKDGADAEPSHIAGPLTALLDGGADVRAYLGWKDGALVASCVCIGKAHRLFVKWAGFDYAAVGEDSGICFAIVVDAPVRDAYADGLRTVEFSAGAQRARAMPGCTTRTMTTVMILSDPQLRPRAARLLDTFGASRHAAFGNHSNDRKDRR